LLIVPGFATNVTVGFTLVVVVVELVPDVPEPEEVVVVTTMQL